MVSSPRRTRRRIGHEAEPIQREADHGQLEGSRKGDPAADFCRRLGICEGTLNRWKAKYLGLKVSEVLPPLVQLIEQTMPAADELIDPGRAELVVGWRVLAGSWLPEVEEKGLARG